MENEVSFIAEDAGGDLRKWVVHCSIEGCTNMPDHVSNKSAHDINFALGYSKEGFPISDWGCFYCGEHAPSWADDIMESYGKP